MSKWLDQDYRVSVIKAIESDENKRRKNLSLRNFEIQKDKTNGHVIDYLKKTYNIESIDEMPIIDSVNVQKRVVSKRGTIYSTPPKRSFTSDASVVETVEAWSSRSNVNKALGKSNKVYIYQEQNFIQVVPDVKNKKFKLRVMQPHHVDVVPFEHDNEIAEAFIVSVFDKEGYETDKQESATGFDDKMPKKSEANNSVIADESDYKSSVGVYVVWTNEFNFFMNKEGFILDKKTMEILQEVDIESILNPIRTIPFIDVSCDKDFSFFVDGQGSLSVFTIQLNAALSDLGQIVRMQGYSQAFLKGPPSALAENVKVGPTYLLKLISEPNAGIETEFGFATPSADITGAIRYIETLLSMFLSSNGVDPKIITTNGETSTYNSGIERLLAMFDEFKASSDDYALFLEVEKKMFELMRLWLVYLGEIRDSEFEMNTVFARPETISTESERLDNFQKKRDLGLSTEIDDISEFYGITKEEAEIKYQEIKKHNESFNDFSIESKDEKFKNI